MIGKEDGRRRRGRTEEEWPTVRIRPAQGAQWNAANEKHQKQDVE